jgi:tRNA modification GTPase
MTSKRQNLLSIEALNYLDKSYQLFTSDMPLEIVAQEIRFFLNKIAEITGEISNNDLYDELFSKFCIGK